MQTPTKPYRYQLPKKAIKSDCPECSPKHQKTLSRYVDTQTGEALPDIYGRCDRESNCGYHLSPYTKDAVGNSYAIRLKEPPIPKAWFKMAAKGKKNKVTPESIAATLISMEGATEQQAEQVIKFIFSRPSLSTLFSPAPIYCIPDEVFTQSLGHYQQNQLAKLLRERFGPGKAQELLDCFQIGTSSRWPGACVFWYIDELGRKRGGQIKLFGNDWHTVKQVDADGKTWSKTSWVHSALLRRHTQQQTTIPDWLAEYEEKAERSPCLFGLPQLKKAPVDTPIAIVEAPKTAIVCTHYLQGFIWLAVGALSYLKAERLAPLRGRKIMLFPDLNAYSDRVNEQGQIIKGWLSRATELRAKGFQVEVSDLLERMATPEQKAAGLDLADFLLTPTQRIVTRIADWKFGTSLRPDESQLERLTFEPEDTNPPDWDQPSTKAAPVLIPSPNQTVTDVLGRGLNMPVDRVPFYQLSNSY